MTQQIPLHTLLGDRYKVTAHVLNTADGDSILDGTDQVLNRKVSIVVAAPTNNSKLVANARSSATSSRASVQILDLGNSGDSTYLITSYARPDALLDTLLTDTGAGTAEQFGEEIFGDTGTLDAPNTYVVAKETIQPATANSGTGTTISASRPVEATADEPAEEYEEYDAEEDGYYEAEENTERNGGMWIVGIAAILLLVIGAGAVFANLGGMVDTNASRKTLSGGDKTASATETADAKEDKEETAASPTSAEKKLATPKLDGNFTRSVPSSPTLMAESDALLGHITDGNASTTWISLAFGSPNFGGLTDSFYLSAKLDEPTTVKSLTINQLYGTGGSFTIYASDSANINGATEIGSGTFAAPGETTVKLNTDKQDGDTQYILVQFTEAPILTQPIVNGYPYGLRIANISIN